MHHRGSPYINNGHGVSARGSRRRQTARIQVTTSGLTGDICALPFRRPVSRFPPGKMNSTSLNRTILDILADDHAKLTAKRRSAHRIDRLFTGMSTELGDSPLSAFFPSRSELHLFRPRSRKSIPPQEARKMALIHCCKTRLSQPSPRPEWTDRLDTLMGNICYRIIESDSFSYTDIQVRGIPKEGNIFRPVVNFCFEEGIIERSFSRFASKMMDPGLLPCSVAYRQMHDGQHPIAALHQFRERHLSGELWCAETDIRNFYDTLDHTVARTAFLHHLDRIPTYFQERALFLLDALLGAYSYPEQALAIGLPALRARHPKATFPWPVDALRGLHGTDPHQLRIGIPQGAALSGLLANLVLDAADRAVMEVARGRESELFYRRYCDDMILVSPDRGLCVAAFDAYRQTLRDLRIPVHPAVSTDDFGREFAHRKSKAVYPWGADPNRHASRIGFIGYQIRHDGQVRIRPSTVKKHMRKMERELQGLQHLTRLGHIPRASTRRIALSYARRIIAMSTGISNTDGNESPSWCNSFAALRDLPFDRRQIEELDRFRNALIGKVVGGVLHLPESSPQRTRTPSGGRCAFPSAMREIRGYPNSYMRFFESPSQPVGERTLR